MDTDTYDRFALWVWLKLIAWAPNIWILCFFSHDLHNYSAATPMAWSILPSSAIWPDKPFSWFKCHEVGVLFHNRRFRSRCDHQSLAGRLKDSPHWLQVIYDDNHEIIWNATQKWLGINVTFDLQIGQEFGISRRCRRGSEQDPKREDLFDLREHPPMFVGKCHEFGDVQI